MPVKDNSRCKACIAEKSAEWLDAISPWFGSRLCAVNEIIDIIRYSTDEMMQQIILREGYRWEEKTTEEKFTVLGRIRESLIEAIAAHASDLTDVLVERLVSVSSPVVAKGFKTSKAMLDYEWNDPDVVTTSRQMTFAGSQRRLIQEIAETDKTYTESVEYFIEKIKTIIRPARKRLEIEYSEADINQHELGVLLIRSLPRAIMEIEKDIIDFALEEHQIESWVQSPMKSRRIVEVENSIKETVEAVLPQIAQKVQQQTPVIVHSNAVMVSEDGQNLEALDKEEDSQPEEIKSPQQLQSEDETPDQMTPEHKALIADTAAKQRGNEPLTKQEQNWFLYLNAKKDRIKEAKRAAKAQKNLASQPSDTINQEEKVPAIFQ